MIQRNYGARFRCGFGGLAVDNIHGYAAKWNLHRGKVVQHARIQLYMGSITRQIDTGAVNVSTDVSATPWSR